MWGKKKKKPVESAEGAEGEEGEEATGGIEMAEKGKDDAASDDKSVGEMKRGDYMIHIFFEKAKDLKCPDDGTVDPMLEVHCLGQKCYSTAKDNIGSMGEVTWSEHLFIEPHQVEKKEAEDGKILIKLLDKGFLKNGLIG